MRTWVTLGSTNKEWEWFWEVKYSNEQIIIGSTWDSVPLWDPLGNHGKHTPQPSYWGMARPGHVPADRSLPQGIRIAAHGVLLSQSVNAPTFLSCPCIRLRKNMIVPEKVLRQRQETMVLKAGLSLLSAPTTACELGRIKRYQVAEQAKPYLWWEENLNKHALSYFGERRIYIVVTMGNFNSHISSNSLAAWSLCWEENSQKAQQEILSSSINLSEKEMRGQTGGMWAMYMPPSLKWRLFFLHRRAEWDISNEI